MRLESVVVHGFKSFAEKTVIRVLPGITAIVGPNGCGKSNISEAIRWALGEQSAKALRGHRMEDLIFHGSASRKAVGLADVELCFSNDGALAVPWSEIAVGRRLYRTGESDYLLNRNACRLRDILDLFAGTGASPRAYSVMDKDKLNHVLSAKPYERRLFIEEAAGIARYKQQRNETQGKLEGTRQNLWRVRDVMDEVKRQLASLERQARKAKAYKDLQGERQRLAVALLSADFAALSSEAARLSAEFSELRDREQALDVRASSLAAQEAGERVRIAAAAATLAGAREMVQRAQGEVGRLLERREQLGVQLRELAEEDVRLAEEARLTDERIGAVSADRQARAVALERAEALAAARSRDVESLQRVLDDQRAALGAERGRLEGLRLEQVRIAAERSDLTRVAGELRERQAQLGRRAARLIEERGASESEADQIAVRQTDLARAREGTLADLAELRERNAQVEQGLADSEPRLAIAQARLAELRVALAAQRSSLESLRRLERAREGYGAGVRAMFGGDGTPRVAGIVGTVADLLEVPAPLDTAVEAVLTDRLQWIVVERFEHAREAVALLRREGAGAATFLPLETLPAPAAMAPDADGVRWVANSVSAGHRGLLHYLLGWVAVVDQLDDAEQLWRRNGVVATYVTRAGEVLSPVGRLTGGREHGPDMAEAEGSLQHRKRAIRELADTVSILEDALGEAQATASALAAEVTALRAELPPLRESLQQGEAAWFAGEKDVELSARERERVTRHLEVIATELRQVTAEHEDTAHMLEQLERRLEVAREADQAQERAVSAIRAAIQSGEVGEAAAVSGVTGCRVELAAALERVEALKREMLQLAETERELALRAEGAGARQIQVRERRERLEAEHARTDTAGRDAARERDRLEVEEREHAERHQRMLEDLRAIESESRAVHADLGRVRGAMHSVELRATECRVRREEIEQDARRTFGVALADAASAPLDPELDTAAARERLQQLDDKLAAFGAVNLVADDEYRELDERLAFLRAQHDDLVSSVKDLEKALRGMTRTAHERFERAFAEINAQFGTMFERLFEGGRAELRLVEPDEGVDPLEAGIELMAQPRGKRLQSVTLMSGGEKALTGLALLFAIFYYRPSPFCVLDEVDAPLDDANIHRFLRVLRELCTQTQFLVITHNRKTMENADVLYGVTMAEPGLSRLVSVNLAQATA